MENCCNLAYQDTFDHKRAKKELADYKKKGVKANSQPLLKLIQNLPLKDAEVLEIGGGIGALVFESFKRGIQRAFCIDISKAYADTFLTESKEKGLEDKIEHYLGDFLEHSDKTPQVDLVILDKVICCYEDYVELINTSSAKAKQWYAFTLPQNNLVVKIGHALSMAVKRLKGDPFTSYIHPISTIKELLKNAGFEEIASSNRRGWKSMLFEKTTTQTKA